MLNNKQITDINTKLINKRYQGLTQAQIEYFLRHRFLTSKTIRPIIEWVKTQPHAVNCSITTIILNDQLFYDNSIKQYLNSYLRESKKGQFSPSQEDVALIKKLILSFPERLNTRKLLALYATNLPAFIKRNLKIKLLERKDLYKLPELTAFLVANNLSFVRLLQGDKANSTILNLFLASFVQTKQSANHQVGKSL